MGKLRNKTTSDELHFFLNGIEVCIPRVDPSLLLIDYLRSPEVGLTGTKASCGQGGCGACTVMLSHRFNPQGNLAHLAIHSCLRPLCSLDGMAVTTVEGIGNCQGGPRTMDPCQIKIATENGSQCGYCTPGWVMTARAFLEAKNGARIRPAEMEEIFDGNLCRCTGYRPIAKAMRDLAKHPPQPLRTAQNLKLSPTPRSVSFAGDKKQYYRPANLADLNLFLKSNSDSSNRKFIAGNTSTGLSKRGESKVEHLVDIALINELRILNMDSRGLTIGASTTYSELIRYLEETTKSLTKANRKHQSESLDAVLYMAKRTGNTTLRNTATIAGNTIFAAHPNESSPPIVSDLLTVLAAVNSRVSIATSASKQNHSIIELIRSYRKLPNEILINSYQIPFSRSNEHIRSYKISRREVNSQSIINAAFRVALTDRRVTDASIIFGGIGPIPLKARRVEGTLIGNPWNSHSLAMAQSTLRDELALELTNYFDDRAAQPYDGIKDEYRIQVAESFLYKFFVTVASSISEGSVPAAVRSAGLRYHRGQSQGSQEFTANTKHSPIGEPLMNRSAFLQATGEAQYIHDMPIPAGGLYAALVISKTALARFFYKLPANHEAIGVRRIVTHLQNQFEGIIDYVVDSDIPGTKLVGAANDQTIFLGEQGQVDWAGQTLGMVLGTSKNSALKAAHHIMSYCIGYDPIQRNGRIMRPVLTIADALDARSFLIEHPEGAPHLEYIYKVERPDSDLTWTSEHLPSIFHTRKDVVQTERCLIAEGEIIAGSQLHFYMETNGCIAEPQEGDRMIVHSTSQDPMGLQQTVSRSLAIDNNRVEVRIHRVGGAFGGKITAPSWLAAATAVAARKHQRPVKLTVPRAIDSAIVGRRQPVCGHYQIAVAAEGVDRGQLRGLDISFFLDTGSTYDLNFAVINSMQLKIDNAYNIPNYRTRATPLQTASIGNTAFRTFGVAQAILITEEAIEASAHSLGVLPEYLRERNLYTDKDITPFGQTLERCNIKQIWNKLKSKARFLNRVREIKDFNRENRWRKRGISMIPLKYGLGTGMASLEQGNAQVQVFLEDATVLVRHCGVDMGQGLHTKVVQVAAYSLNLPTSMIEVAASSTFSIPNPVPTAASVSNELRGGAVRKACEILRRRLEEFAYGLRKEYGNKWCQARGIDFWNYKNGWRDQLAAEQRGPDDTKPTLVWHKLITQAFLSRVSLTSNINFAQQGSDGLISGAWTRDNSMQLRRARINEFYGFTYSAACSEVEIDVLTGTAITTKTDIIYDIGNSLNPAIDLGQVEGAFVQGLGSILYEEVLEQPDGQQRGRLNTTNVESYMPPSLSSIPRTFNVQFFNRQPESSSRNPNLIYSSKTAGEPPLILANTVYFAIKHAIFAARQDLRGETDWFDLELPLTPQRIRQACLVTPPDLNIKSSPNNSPKNPTCESIPRKETT